ncbi:MAG: response regulator [Chloroflexia bacterium]
MARILLVDDSALVRRILRGFLESAGHQIVEAQDGISGLEAYYLEKPDLVLLDLTMEGMHGLDVLRELLRMDPSARVVVATADIQRSTQEMAEGAGACGFVSKPFVREHVLEAVRQALSREPGPAAAEEGESTFPCVDGPAA